MPKNILIIKLGSLGDFVQSVGLFRAVRKAYPDAKLHLLTTKPFVAMAEKTKLFDAVHIDTRPKALDLKGWLAQIKFFKKNAFDIVIDLQNTDRTGLYARLFNIKETTWIGKAKACDIIVNHQSDPNLHIFEAHKKNLEQAGFKDIEIDDLSWMAEPLEGLDTPKRFMLVVPGSAANRTVKRWPVENYAALCQWAVREHGVTPLILGSAAESDVVQVIVNECPSAISLVGKTSFGQIITLGQEALCAVGNDTGPMHMLGQSGCRSLGLFPGFSLPKRHAPYGPNVKTIQKEQMADITLVEVCQILGSFLATADR